MPNPQKKFVHQVVGLGMPYSSLKTEESFLTEFVTQSITEILGRNYRRSVTPFRNDIYLFRTDAVEDIPLHHRKSARKLRITQGSEQGVIDLKILKDFKNLRELSIGSHISTLSISEISAFPELRRFSCEDDLDEPIPFSELPKLQEISVSGRKNIANISDGTQLGYIRIDNIGADVPYLGGLRHLTRLDLVQSRKLSDLKFISGSKSIEVLLLYGCQNLKDLRIDNNELNLLKDLTIESCHKIESLSGFRDTCHLARVELRSCRKLANISILNHLKRPIDIIIVGCPKIGGIVRQELRSSSKIRFFYFE